MKPRFTDIDRYPEGYTPSGSTDLKAKFRRIIAAYKASAKVAEEQATQDAAEAALKVAPMVRKAVKS